MRKNSSHANASVSGAAAQLLSAFTDFRKPAESAPPFLVGGLFQPTGLGWSQPISNINPCLPGSHNPSRTFTGLASLIGRRLSPNPVVMVFIDSPLLSELFR